MMKKWICAITVFWCLLLPLTVSASTAHIVNDFPLVTQAQVGELKDRISIVSDRHEMDIVILSVKDTGDLSTREYAKNYYDENNCGYGETKAGLLVIYTNDVPESKLFAWGTGDRFTQEELNFLLDEFAQTSDGYDACSNFINEVDSYLSQSEGAESEPTTVPDLEEEPESISPQLGQRVVDLAELLSELQERNLSAQFDAIAAKYDCDIAVVTTLSLGEKTPHEYAEDTFFDNGYGIGENRRGVIFIISMEERDWTIFASKEMELTVFTQWSREFIGSQVQPKLSSGSYGTAFELFGSLSEKFLAQAETGKPYSEKNKLVTDENKFFRLLVALAIGLVAATLVTLRMQAKLKNVKAQQLAHEYIRKGSFRVTGENQMFSYKSVTKTKIVHQSSSGSSSSSHSSSRGGSTSGKF
jgi:uncharacterized protein